MIMAKKVLKPLSIVVAIVAIMLIFVISKFKTTARLSEVEIGNATVKAEIADTMAKQMQGLMFRDGLGKNEGMLFVFGGRDYHGIWMMNMSFPIDIVWINDGKVVDIYKGAQPCGLSCPVYTARGVDNYILEVNSGFVEKHGIKIGDSVKIGK
jgi:uncharacterized membrane protein (UPF0127 family)